MSSCRQNVIHNGDLNWNRLHQFPVDNIVLVEIVRPGPVFSRVSIMHSFQLGNQLSNVHAITEQFQDTSHSVIIQRV